MPSYDFQALSSYDFEVLARDLLQADLKIRLESFGKGRDGGIDFRFRMANGDLVVQCKHYADYDDLYRVLKRDEVKKLVNLKPARYVLVVSTPLTPHRKDELVKLFEPYNLRLSDVLGREDLNNLLGLYPEVERRHIKLWLTSNEVLSRVLNSGIWGDAELTLQRIRLRTSRYVPNPSVVRAKRILDKHRYCIIAGIPGIGKTTLAEILLIEHVDRYEFQAVRIANDLSEIKSVKDANRRQIFYFDDFLGKTALDKLEKNEDQRLMEFMEEVKNNSNWRLILTTREYILNSARIRHEAFENPPVDLTPCIIELADYTEPIRARILYNHIYFSDLSSAYKRALLQDKRYVRVLSHPNYNPRIIEHMTQARYAEVDPPDKYFELFIENLANPTRIWNHAFRFQLTEGARHVLLVMGSLPDEVLLTDLEAAFTRFYQYRRSKIGFGTSSRDFEMAIRELDGNFIRSSLVAEEHVVRFHNPSVADFLESYLSSSPDDVADLIESAVFFDQFRRLWSGQRGKRFSGVDRHAEEFSRAIERQFLAPDCRLAKIVRSGDKVIAVRRRDSSLEDRIAFGVEIATGLSTPGATALVNRSLKDLRIRLEERKGNKGDLVRLLLALASSAAQGIENCVFDAARIYLTEDLGYFDDFENAASLVHFFPEAVEDSDLETICESFSKFCETYDAEWADGADDLRYAADELETVGSRLGVNVEQYCDTMRQRAAELDDERDDDPRDDDQDEDWEPRDSPVDGIDSMFDGLLQEIDEKSE